MSERKNMKNKMEQVAQLLGVELGEEFSIKGLNGSRYKLLENGLYHINAECFSRILVELISGEEIIEKLPKLKGRIKKEDFVKDLKYYYVDTFGGIVQGMYIGCYDDPYRINNISLFYTYEECEKYLEIQNDIRELSYDFSDEDWGDLTIKKYYLCYAGDSCKMDSVFVLTQKAANIHFKENPLSELLKKYSHKELYEYYIKCV